MPSFTSSRRVVIVMRESYPASGGRTTRVGAGPSCMDAGQEKEHTARMPDWDGLRIFLALSRGRTLAAAARKLGVDETTVARRLARLEKEIGASLVERAHGGLALTAAGEAVRAAAEEMESAALTAERRVLGADRQLSGRVRVTAPEILGTYFVLPALKGASLSGPTASRRCSKPSAWDGAWAICHASSVMSLPGSSAPSPARS